MSKKQYSFNNDFVQFFVKSSIASEPKFWSRFKDCLVSCDSSNFVKNCVSPRRNHYFHKVGDVENQNFIYKYLQDNEKTIQIVAGKNKFSSKKLSKTRAKSP